MTRTEALALLRSAGKLFCDADLHCCLTLGPQEVVDRLDRERAVAYEKWLLAVRTFREAV